VEAAFGHCLERVMHRRRADAVQPAAPIAMTRRREGGAGQLLGIKAVRDLLRRILPFGQHARQGLGGEFVGETRLVLQVAG